MIKFEIFLFGLLIVSTFTGLATEAVKKVLAERNTPYRANTLAGVIATVVALAVGLAYVILAGISFNAQVIVCLVALVFMGWLCAMVGYDKVIQAISQFKTSTKTE